MKVPDENLTFLVLANTSNLSTPFPMGYGDVLASAVALAFYREFVFPRRHDTPLPIVDWAAPATDLTAQLAGITDEAARRFVGRELWSYRRAFHSVGRHDDAARLDTMRRELSIPPVGHATYLNSAAMPAPAPPVDLSDAQLEALAGSYSLDIAASGLPPSAVGEVPHTFSVTVAGGRLVACGGDASPLIMTPVGGDRFRAEPNFVIDAHVAGGVVRGLTVEVSGFGTLEYVAGAG